MLKIEGSSCYNKAKNKMLYDISKSMMGSTRAKKSYNNKPLLLIGSGLFAAVLGYGVYRLVRQRDTLRRLNGTNYMLEYVSDGVTYSMVLHSTIHPSQIRNLVIESRKQPDMGRVMELEEVSVPTYE